MRKEEIINDVMILGAGASGMMCAAQLNELSDLKVLVVEGNEKAAKKLKISGGGKCNITNVSVTPHNYLGDEELIESIFSQFSKDDLLLWLEKRGLTPVIRKEQYYFCPKSSDEIISILARASRKSRYVFNQKIHSLVKSDCFELVTDQGRFKAKNVVIATGAKSFAALGASEIGLELARHFGHAVKPFVPALAGLTLQAGEFWMKELSGISFPAEVSVDDKILREDMLLTHRGLSGPVILSASLYWSRGEISINFLPGSTLRELMHNNRKLLSTALPLPKRFTQALLDAAAIKEKPCNSYKEDELKTLEHLFHYYTFAPAGTYGFSKAEVCKGGIRTDNINSWTLESNLVEGLYFAGEVLDVTGELGGYNFQWAFSSAVAVAKNITGI
ncbi:aminoacetone oxidase family FAD-binding enzyme [Sulfurimonas sp. HSL3-7]|uniref:NAD(P)/FAD-dependent oxidoreductase n=1 Tax=Sulfonitrofixus jiaomeiensis TaxID=3131938 RepID=UPI0031F9A657